MRCWVGCFALILLLVSMADSAMAVQTRQCLYINSYHAGYAWSDKIEQAIQKELAAHCTVTVFRMDTKRHTDAAFGRRKALEAKALIASLHPDVVLASDDNASKYLVAPYYKNAAIPFVFCGINWTAEPYGYPYRNATGMIEVSAIEPLLHKARMLLGDVQHVAFIGVKGVRTDEKEFAWMKKTYAHSGVELSPYFVSSMQEWEQAYRDAQQDDLIVLNNIAGIPDWNKNRAMRFVRQHAGKLTVSTYDFMAPYTMLAMTKVAAEQGQWAAQVAIRILQGKSPASIPVVANRRFHMFVNPAILKHTSIRIPEAMMFKAIKVRP